MRPAADVIRSLRSRGRRGIADSGVTSIATVGAHSVGIRPVGGRPAEWHAVSSAGVVFAATASFFHGSECILILRIGILRRIGIVA